MGWRGAVRSMAAASRAAQRDSERRYKQALKAQTAADAADAVAEWEEIIRDLVSLHVDHADAIDWRGIAVSDMPQPPKYSDKRERAARAKLDDFRPGKLDFLKGGSAKRRQRLVDAVAQAKQSDEQTFQQTQDKYVTDLADWKADTALAERLLAGEAAAMRDVINEMQSLSKDGLIGTEIRFDIDDGAIHAIVRIHGDEIVPKVRRKQLASGRLTESKMPAGEFNELYQDYVTSAALRVGADLLGLLPLDEVYVTCTPLMLDSKSGHLQHTPILSVQIVRETLDRLRLAAIDPSDAMSNFNHAMSFKRAKGFTAIEPLRPIDQ
jgi:hypothetical protein